jgi:DNA-directed RNA polymerase specialized sigma24 family protein
VRSLLVQTLEPDDRARVLLRYVHGFTSDELSRMTGRSAPAIRQALVRARRRLLLAAHEEEWEER